MALALLGAAACKGGDDDTDAAQSQGGSSGNATGASGGSGGSGGSVTNGTGGSGASAGTGASGGSSGSGDVREDCNELTLDVPAFTLKFDPNDAPVAEGGTIVDGTYAVTESTAYGLEYPDIEGGRTKLKISGTSWEEVDNVDAEPGLDPDEDYTSTFSTSGTKLTIEQTCPTIADPTTESTYTADADGFTLFIVDHGVTFGIRLVRQ